MQCFDLCMPKFGYYFRVQLLNEVDLSNFYIALLI